MEYKIFDTIGFNVSPQKINNMIGIDDEEITDMVEDLCSSASKIAKPKAATAAVYIDNLTDNSAEIEGIVFNSSLLSRNLRETEKAVLYILTCGREIYEWSRSLEGYMEIYIAEQIKITTLSSAQAFLNDYIRKEIFPENSSSMNPGSLKDWPLIEQRKLFRLLREPSEKIGVELTESCLMIPDKSVSGIIFQKKKSFVNCMLCDRKNCPGRMAEYTTEA